MSNNEKAAQEEVSQVTAGQQETAAEKASPVKPQQQQPKAVEPDTGAGEDSRDSVVSAEGEKSVEDGEGGDEEAEGDEEGDTGDDEQPAVEKSNGHAGKNGKAGVGEEAGAEVNGTDAKVTKI
jgi:hypothetical protein